MLRKRSVLEAVEFKHEEGSPEAVPGLHREKKRKPEGISSRV